MMIEPTETESIESLDMFTDILGKIVEEINTKPEMLIGAPSGTNIKGWMN